MAPIPLGSVAEALGGAGIHVFPVLPGAKRPATRTGLRAATRDQRMIRAWWERLPTANIGIACGSSRLVVIDCDCGKPWPLDTPPPEGVSGGDDMLVALAQEAGADPGFLYAANSVSVVTPSGGLHLYYRAPEGRTVRSSAGRVAPWIDVRAAGGYVVAPFSVTPAGDYRPLLGWEQWVRTDADSNFQPVGVPLMTGVTVNPPELPAWLLGRLTGQERATEQDDMFTTLLAALDRLPVGSRDGYAMAALGAETTAVATAVEGTRNHTLNGAAFSLGTLVGAGALDETTVTTALEISARQCGLTADEARQTIRSGLRAGKANPRAVAGL